MNKAISSGQKKTIIIVLGVVMALLIGVLTTSTVVVIKASEGKDLPLHNKKDLSKPLGSDSNPFTILEIVPDVDSATVGYLNRGTAPGESDDYTLLRIGVTDRNVEGSAANIYEKAFASGNSPASQMGDPEISHLFERDIETIDFVDFIVKYDEYQGMGTSDRDKAFSEFGYFTKVNSEAGSYVYNTNAKRFEPMNPFNKDSYDHFEWTSLGEFKHVGQGGVAAGRVACTRDMYSLDGQPRQFSYDNGVRRESESVPVNGAVGDKAYRYYYSSIGDFEWVPNSNYNNEDIFIENASDQSIREARENDKFYMTRTENVYYEFEASPIVSNDILAKELKESLGENNRDLTNFKTDVITVTPAQLDVSNSNINAMNIIDDADLIIIHDSSVGYRIKRALDDKEFVEVPRFINTNGGSGDLPYETVKYIINRGAGYDRENNLFPVAIVIDDDAINTANSYGKDSPSNCTNLKLLCDIYNNLGAKLAYNLSPIGDNYVAKLSTMKNDSEYKSYYRNYDYNNRGEFKDALGKSNFVYNYEGKDDSWITTDFANNNKINNNNETMPAFENVGGGQTMSVARMMAAVYKESQGYNQPKSLRLLELQPNEKFYYNVLDKDSWVKKYVSLFPWFIGTDKDIGNGDVEGDGDVKITKMPTYEFIGRNEDINENYDMIIVGNKEQDETNGGNKSNPGYNDDLPPIMAYTAVGDIITRYGGDETLDKGKENNQSYKNSFYGLFKGNIWSTAKNAFISSENRWYEYSEFKKGFVYDYYGGHGTWIANSRRGPWWYQYNLSEDEIFFGANSYPVFATKHGSDANMIELRYSGNDLTKKKYDQLIDFAKQGPVIVDDDLYKNEQGNPEEPNHNKIDRSSFVYQLANKNQDVSAVNKYTHGVSDRSGIVKKNIEDNKCFASFSNTIDNKPGLPREYYEADDVNYNMQKDLEGNNVLQYHFTLEGSSDVEYGVNVYTDSNSNGIFESCISHKHEIDVNIDKNVEPDKYNEATKYKEVSPSLTIYDESIKGPINDGKLYSGHTYLVTKNLPATDVGMVPWKLEIYDKNNDSVRYSKIGHTRIMPPKSMVKTINVLQMNLTPDMNSEASDATVNFADDNTYVGRKFYEYTNKDSTSPDKIDDFNIQIEYMSNADWRKDYRGKKEEWARKLMSYDMLVIGFKDVAMFTNDEDYIYGFEKFREAGKSIILGHDLVQDTSIGYPDMVNTDDVSSIIQSDVRYYLRDISGQLRKYFDAASGSNDYSYLEYKTDTRSRSFEPSNDFKIFTSIKETHEFDFQLYRGNNVYFEARNNDDTPIYDKYVYTYGNFAESEGWGRGFAGKTIKHPIYNYYLTEPNSVVRDYYKNHEYKKANMIMDNSTRALLYYNYIDYKSKLDRPVNVNVNSLSDRRKLTWGWDAYYTNKVKKANEGQITKYPFAIPDSLFVADTHAQNYQLDLEYDSDGDVLVWYNLSGVENRNDGGHSYAHEGSIDVYSGRKQDSRNNYYIYTKNNITYTGLGHSKERPKDYGDNNYSPMTDDEIKLFVNTMVASYRSGASDPYITVLNPDAINYGDTTTLYVEERDNGANSYIIYRIDDDTTNPKITRQYDLEVYKGGELIDTINSAKRGEEYAIPVSYSDVYANGEVNYRIVVNSSYKNNQDVEIKRTGERYVNVDIMPMFGLR